MIGILGRGSSMRAERVVVKFEGAKDNRLSTQ